MVSQLSVKISPKEMEAIDSAVQQGYAMNRSDFVKLAIRNKLTECEERRS